MLFNADVHPTAVGKLPHEAPYAWEEENALPPGMDANSRTVW